MDGSGSDRTRNSTYPAYPHPPARVTYADRCRDFDLVDGVEGRDLSDGSAHLCALECLLIGRLRGRRRQKPVCDPRGARPRVNFPSSTTRNSLAGVTPFTDDREFAGRAQQRAIAHARAGGES